MKTNAENRERGLRPKSLYCFRLAMQQINLPAYSREEIPVMEKYILYIELLKKDTYLRDGTRYTIDDFIENKPINQ